jgi:two-component system sensor histidine kinase VicK
MKEIEELRFKLKILEKENAELHNRVNELNDFFENASLPLHWVNGSGIIIWANQVELDMLGYTKDEYIGRHIEKFHADKEVISDILNRLVNKETLINYHARLLTKAGKIKHVLINSNVLWKGEKFIHTRCFTRDISELKDSDQKKVDVIISLEETNKLLKAENLKFKRELGITK